MSTQLKSAGETAVASKSDGRRTKTSKARSAASRPSSQVEFRRTGERRSPAVEQAVAKTIYVRQDDPFQWFNHPTMTVAPREAKPESEGRSLTGANFGNVKINIRSTTQWAPRTVAFAARPPEPVASPVAVGVVEPTSKVSTPEPVPAPALQPEVAALGPVDAGLLAKARKSARDAWWAVSLMGLFIVGGFVWTSGSLSHAEARIDALTERVLELTQALTAEHTSALTLKQENNRLYQDLAKAEHDASAHGETPAPTASATAAD